MQVMIEVVMALGVIVAPMGVAWLLLSRRERHDPPPGVGGDNRRHR
jgi:hypothetical protein